MPMDLNDDIPRWWNADVAIASYLVETLREFAEKAVTENDPHLSGQIRQVADYFASYEAGSPNDGFEEAWATLGTLFRGLWT